MKAFLVLPIILGSYIAAGTATEPLRPFPTFVESLPRFKSHDSSFESESADFEFESSENEDQSENGDQNITRRTRNNFENIHTRRRTSFSNDFDDSLLYPDLSEPEDFGFERPIYKQAHDTGTCMPTALMMLFSSMGLIANEADFEDYWNWLMRIQFPAAKAALRHQQTLDFPSLEKIPDSGYNTFDIAKYLNRKNSKLKRLGYRTLVGKSQDALAPQRFFTMMSRHFSRAKKVPVLASVVRIDDVSRGHATDIDYVRELEPDEDGQRWLVIGRDPHGKKFKQIVSEKNGFRYGKKRKFTGHFLMILPMPRGTQILDESYVSEPSVLDPDLHKVAFHLVKDTSKPQFAKATDLYPSITALLEQESAAEVAKLSEEVNAALRADLPIKEDVLKRRSLSMKDRIKLLKLSLNESAVGFILKQPKEVRDIFINLAESGYLEEFLVFDKDIMGMEAPQVLALLDGFLKIKAKQLRSTKPLTAA